ncbi:hypothetical protein [Pseudoalteromonas tunicata]|uniref:Uncharacterized protein n=1 Tax=Pseudoalteromonas tunicata D2 TaxID=87626 RepID=A4CE09_9GAMM|nr:hypothetical protein [Pseudoalteromonas tunicata]ATC96306.1 hypothetical protein PTUN_a4080 [Pseudoalteromonas tunicata]AXT31813.1 hypothetical protein D1819_13965 [Pseudoalteromonas tunicata]EAR27201.1 hypothetical protein PTD2_06005 [Pseudoalteromonas tunicata D2]MDP4983450.1 hypothetical protein [Pseudoalteromonas tunicata]
MKKNNKTYQTARLSAIPNMASAVSKKISLFQQQHRKVVEDATAFYQQYPLDIDQLRKYKKKLNAYAQQIEIIEKYKKEHGVLPQIAGQKSPEKYLHQLYMYEQNDKKAFTLLRQQMAIAQTKRYENLDHLTDNMLDLLNNQRIFSQFLGTLVLSTPLPDEKIRCVRNEKFKPIYIAGLVVALFEQIRITHGFKNRYLVEAMSDMFADPKASFMDIEQNSLSHEEMAAYREEVLKPVAKAALLLSIGSYSPQVEDIFAGDRYRLLSQQERELLVATIKIQSTAYLKLGIGIPPQRFNTHQEKLDYTEYEKNKLEFMLSFFSDENNDNCELQRLLKIPVVYSSFMISTKPEFDYRRIYDAYDTIRKSAVNNELDQNYSQLFLAMVGRFPIGSGIYFFNPETESIEQAIVSSLYPDNPHQPICKQITRRQLKSMTQQEIIVPVANNIFFESARHKSGYDDEYFTLKYQNSFVWNANEVWEVQIPALDFWKKDGTRKVCTAPMPKANH